MLLYEDLTYKLRGIFFKVYNELGPGLPERAYLQAIIYELERININFKIEEEITIFYHGRVIWKQRLDLVIDSRIVIEVKATAVTHPLFIKQTIAYLKAGSYQLGLLVNFGGDQLIIKRFINTNNTDHAD